MVPAIVTGPCDAEHTLQAIQFLE